MHNKNSYGRLHNLSLVLTKFLKQNYDLLTLAIKILKRPRKSSFLGAGTYRARFFQKCPKCFAIQLTCFSVLKDFLSLQGGVRGKDLGFGRFRTGLNFSQNTIRPCASRKINKLPYLTKCPHQGHKCFEGFLALHFNHIYILFTNIVLWGVLEVPTKRFFAKSV